MRPGRGAGSKVALSLFSVHFTNTLLNKIISLGIDWSCFTLWFYLIVFYYENPNPLMTE